MGYPTNDEIAVATETLRKEAGTWEAESENLTSIASAVDGTRFTRLEAGLFQILVSANDSLVTHVADRCTEGASRFQDVASTLRSVATTYDDEEARLKDQLNGLY